MRLITTAALALVASHGFAAGTKSLGLAQSDANFTIQRDSKAVQGHPGSLVPVEAGDKVSAVDRHIQIQTPAGDAVLLQSGASAEFTKPGSVSVVSGNVILATRDAAGMRISADELTLQPIGEAKSKVPFMVAMSRSKPNEIKLAGFGNSFSVRAGDSEKQLAVLGAQDMLTVTKGEKGWVVSQAETAAAPAKPGEPEPVEEEDETGQKKKRRSVAGWWNPTDPAAAGAGAAAAPGAAVFGVNPNFMGPVTMVVIGAGLGFVVNDQLFGKKQSNQGSGNGRGPSSQIEPTPIPVLGGN